LHAIKSPQHLDSLPLLLLPYHHAGFHGAQRKKKNYGRLKLAADLTLKEKSDAQKCDSPDGRHGLVGFRKFDAAIRFKQSLAGSTAPAHPWHLGLRLSSG
jgi:hypothetical protein